MSEKRDTDSRSMIVKVMMTGLNHFLVEEIRLAILGRLVLDSMVKLEQVKTQY